MGNSHFAWSFLLIFTRKSKDKRKHVTRIKQTVRETRQRIRVRTGGGKTGERRRDRVEWSDRLERLERRLTMRDGRVNQLNSCEERTNAETKKENLEC